MKKQECIVRNQFTNKKNPPRKGSVSYHIADYTLRDTATELTVVKSEQLNQCIKALKHASLTQLNQIANDATPITALNRLVQANGVGFSLSNIATSPTEQKNAADTCQAAYDKGYTVRQMVISFDTNFLEQNNLLTEKINKPVLAGDLRGKVDQIRLRTATQQALKAMFKRTKMVAPEMIAAIQTDTRHVHIHLSVWDEKAPRSSDWGQFTPKQIDAFRDTFDQVNQQLQPSPQITQALVNTCHSRLLKAKTEKVNLLESFKQYQIHATKNNLANYVEKLIRYNEKNSLSKQSYTKLTQSIEQKLFLQATPQFTTTEKSIAQQYTQRQIKAYRISDQLMNSIDKANIALLKRPNNLLAKVKEALSYELHRANLIVAKYNRFNADALQNVYQVRKYDLMQRQEQLKADYLSIQHELPHEKLDTAFLRELITSEAFKNNLKTVEGVKQISQSPSYQELVGILSHPESPLSFKTIKTVLKCQPEKEKNATAEALLKNQRLQTQLLTTAQRRRIQRYLFEVERYENDCVRYGGLNATDAYQYNGMRQLLPLPKTPQSIYQRKNDFYDPKVLAVDAHQLLPHNTPANKLKPQIYKAQLADIKQRTQKLRSIYEFAQATHQESPQWYIDLCNDLKNQYKVNGLQEQQPTWLKKVITTNQNETDKATKNQNTINTSKQKVVSYYLDRKQSEATLTENIKQVQELSI